MKLRFISVIILGAGLLSCAQVSEEQFPLVGELGHKTIREYKNDLTLIETTPTTMNTRTTSPVSA